MPTDWFMVYFNFSHFYNWQNIQQFVQIFLSGFSLGAQTEKRKKELGLIYTNNNDNFREESKNGSTSKIE